MLKIQEISKELIPEFVWNRIHDKNLKKQFSSIYISDGMFGGEPDYLLVLEINDNRYFGFVYNGNAPECSEFGSFGLNKEKTERVW